MTRAIRSSLAALALVAAAAMPAAAQVAALGTTKGGATAQVSTAIANVVSAAGQVQIRPQAMANTSQYIPMVNAGRIEFGIANLPQTMFAVQGTGMSSEPNPDLRMVATLFPFAAGITVPADLGLQSYADLAGRAVPRFPDNSLGDFVIRAALNAGGLTYADVEEVPTANFPAMWEAMKQGRTVISIAAVGSQPTYDLQAALGGIDFLDFAPEDEAKFAETMPGSFLMPIPASADLPGVGDGTVVFAYDYTLFAHKDVDDAVVSAVVQALYEGEDALRESSPLWRDYNKDDIAKDVGIEYHPGALAYFQSVGLR